MIPDEAVEAVHVLLANHDGDPQCLCGFMSPPVTGVFQAASGVAKHVKNPYRSKHGE